MAFGLKSAEHVRRALRAADATAVWIGIQSTQGAQPKTSPEPTDGEVPTLAEVAAVHEFGAVVTIAGVRVRIPQRSYLRSTADATGSGWVRVFRRALIAYANGDEAEYDRLVASIGVVATGQVRRRIRRRIEPRLSPITVARRRKGPGKGDDVPLIDTGQLIGSIRAQAHTVAGPRLIG